jgi:tetrapyrrole methylase family protein/MazG family protein
MVDELFIFDRDDDEEMPLDFDPEETTLQLVPAEEVLIILEAAPFGGGTLPLSPLDAALVRGIYSSEIAAKVQNALLRIYPADTIVTLFNENDDGDDAPREFKLSDLAEQKIGTGENLLLPPVEPMEHTRVIEGLQQIIASLRAPGGCPWDREQTHQSLTRYMIEEAYETVQAIESAGPSELAEELGDVLLQVLLHAQIAEENGSFTLEDVFEILAAKMVRRHPHVFGDRTVETATEVVTAWDQIKQQERSDKPDDEAASAFGSIPPALPALARAQTMLRRAESQGMDSEQMFGRVASKMSESGGAEDVPIAEQLAAIARDARARGIDAEGALRRWTECFERVANESAAKTEER